MLALVAVISIITLGKKSKSKAHRATSLAPMSSLAHSLATHTPFPLAALTTNGGTTGRDGGHRDGTLQAQAYQRQETPCRPTLAKLPPAHTPSGACAGSPHSPTEDGAPGAVGGVRTQRTCVVVVRPSREKEKYLACPLPHALHSRFCFLTVALLTAAFSAHTLLQLLFVIVPFSLHITLIQIYQYRQDSTVIPWTLYSLKAHVLHARTQPSPVETRQLWSYIDLHRFSKHT